MKPDFFQVLKPKTSHTPSRALDQIILRQAASELAPVKSQNNKRWAFALVPVAAALVIWLQLRPATLPTAMIAESPERLRHMDEVELWVEVADLSEEEWRYVATGET